MDAAEMESFKLKLLKLEDLSKEEKLKLLADINKAVRKMFPVDEQVSLHVDVAGEVSNPPKRRRFFFDTSLVAFYYFPERRGAEASEPPAQEAGAQGGRVREHGQRGLFSRGVRGLLRDVPAGDDDQHRLGQVLQRRQTSRRHGETRNC